MYHSSIVADPRRPGSEKAIQSTLSRRYGRAKNGRAKCGCTLDARGIQNSPFQLNFIFKMQIFIFGISVSNCPYGPNPSTKGSRPWNPTCQSFPPKDRTAAPAISGRDAPANHAKERRGRRVGFTKIEREFALALPSYHRKNVSTRIFPLFFSKSPDSHFFGNFVTRMGSLKPSP